MTEAQTATAIAEAGAKALGKASLNKRNPARKTRKGKKAKAKLTEVEKAIYMAQGRLVRKGERAVHIGPFALFHISQTSETAVTAKSPAANSAAA